MSNDSGAVSRRDFLRTGAAALGYSALAPKGQLKAQAVDDSITPVLKRNINKQWVDQYAKPFDVNSLAGKPYVLIFGFNGCQYCNLISQNLARLRESQSDAVQHLPIVVVNVTPETDRANTADKAQDHEDRKNYVSGYYGFGICQSPEAAQKIRETADAQKMDVAGEQFEADANIAQKDRKFHLVFPPSNQAAQALQEALGVIRAQGDDQSHGMMMAVVDGSGKCVASKYAATSSPKKCEALVNEITAAVEAMPASHVRGQ
jgi:cytochrome oxidase Cu insertion factor (SCO1/SenC/PrrC family)